MVERGIPRRELLTLLGVGTAVGPLSRASGAAASRNVDADEQLDGVAADVQSNRIANEHLSVFVGEAGNFSMATADGSQLTYPNERTSALTVRVDGTNYVVGSLPATSMDQYVAGSPSFSSDGTTATTRWRLPEEVTVTQRISLTGAAAAFELVVENTGSTARDVDFRYLFDYQVGPQDGAPIFVNGEVLTTETRFDPPAFDSWLTYDRLPNPTLTGEGTVGTRPDRIEFVAWEDADQSVYEYDAFDSSKAFYQEGHTESPQSDSAGLLYYDLGQVSAGDEASVTTFYGSGEPERGSIDDLDAALADYREAVTGYIDTVVGAKANGYASQYLREEADAGYPNINGSDDRSEAFRNTVVKFFEYRAGVADRDEIDLGYFDDIRTLTDTIPEELSDDTSASLYRFADEMFESVPPGDPDEVEERAAASFREHLLGTVQQDDALTVDGRTVSELRDAFVSGFDDRREAFVEECRDAGLAPGEVSALVAQVARRTERLQRTANRKHDSYEKLVQMAVDGEEVASTAEVAAIGGAVGSVVGGTIGLGVGLLLAGPTGEEPILIGIGTSVGGAIGSTAGGLIAPVLTDGDVGGNRWESSFVGSDTWKAIAAYEVQWLYHFKRAPNRVLPAELLNYASGDLDAQVTTVAEGLFDLGCEAAVAHLSYDVAVDDVSTQPVTEDDRIGDSALARQEGTLTVRNPSPNDDSVRPTFLREECYAVSHTTASESQRGYVTLPPRREFPEISPGETAEIPFSYVVPARSNADFGIEFRLKASSVSSNVTVATDVVDHRVGVSDSVETSVVSSGRLPEGESVESSVDTGPASKSVVDLSYPGSDLDLHLYSNGDHVGRNYRSGEYERQVPGTSGTGPDGGDGFESIRLEDVPGSFRTEVVAVSAPDRGSPYSVTSATSGRLPASMTTRPTRVNVAGTPDDTASARLTLRETAGDTALSGLSVEPTALTDATTGESFEASSVRVTPEDDSVPAGGQTVVDLSFDVPEGAVNGRYTGAFSVGANGGDVTASVPVELHVVGGASPGLLNSFPSLDDVPPWAPGAAVGAGSVLGFLGFLRYINEDNGPS